MASPAVGSLHSLVVLASVYWNVCSQWTGCVLCLLAGCVPAWLCAELTGLHKLQDGSSYASEGSTTSQYPGELEFVSFAGTQSKAASSAVSGHASVGKTC